MRLSKRFGNVKALDDRCHHVDAVGLPVRLTSCRLDSEFYILACVVGLVMGGSQALSRSTYAKFLPETDDHASYFSFYDVSYYVGTVLGTAVYGAVFAITGDLRNTVIGIGLFFVMGLSGLRWRGRRRSAYRLLRQHPRDCRSEPA